MPSWVKDEDVWNKAKNAFRDSYGNSPSSDKDYAILTTIYKNMGGTIASLLKHVVRTGNSRTAVFLHRKLASWVTDSLKQDNQNLLSIMLDLSRANGGRLWTDENVHDLIKHTGGTPQLWKLDRPGIIKSDKFPPGWNVSVTFPKGGLQDVEFEAYHDKHGPKRKMYIGERVKSTGLFMGRIEKMITSYIESFQ